MTVITNIVFLPGAQVLTVVGGRLRSNGHAVLIFSKTVIRKTWSVYYASRGGGVFLKKESDTIRNLLLALATSFTLLASI